MAYLYDMMGLNFSVEQPRGRYLHGCGQTYTEVKQVACTWTMKGMEIHKKPKFIPFHLFEGASPLIVGLGVKTYVGTHNSHPRLPSGDHLTPLPWYLTLISGRIIRGAMTYSGRWSFTQDCLQKA